jgi:hypothetical protein
MATIRNEVAIEAPAEAVWEAMRDFGAVHERVVPGFVTECKLEGDARVIKFANGLVARERLVDLDDEARRLVYAIPEGLAEHYNAAVEVVADGQTRCSVIWVIDLLPHALAPQVRAMTHDGVIAMKRALDRLGKPAAEMEIARRF